MIAERIKGSPFDKCQMCHDYVKKTPFRYKPTQFVPDWEPEEIIACRKCVYREVYGSKNFKKKMKEGTLDG